MYEFDFDERKLLRQVYSLRHDRKWKFKKIGNFLFLDIPDCQERTKNLYSTAKKAFTENNLGFYKRSQTHKQHFYTKIIKLSSIGCLMSVYKNINDFDVLNEQQKKILIMRKYFTLKKIGIYLNLSKERIRQIEAKAWRRLKSPSDYEKSMLLKCH